jgi:hypothetical protein
VRSKTFSSRILQVHETPEYVRFEGRVARAGLACAQRDSLHAYGWHIAVLFTNVVPEGNTESQN